MAKQRRLIARLLLAALLVGLALGWPAVGAAQSGDEPTEEPTEEVVPLEEEEGAPPPAPPAQEIPAGYALVGENGRFQLHANEATLAFKVVDKRNGYVWSSNLDEVTEEDRLNRTWTAFATSGVSIDFLDEEADSERASITNADHTIDFATIEQGFEATLTFTKPSISMLVRVRLEEAGVRVEVPFETIREGDPEFRIGLLHLYPFMGATREDAVPGYMFIPDGAGTLIDLRAQTKARNMFLGRYYGPDLGMIGALPYDPLVNRPMPITLPVTGFAHGVKANGYISVVESGASYGELRAHPAGVITRFNFVYNAFLYNQSYFQATNRSGAGVTTLQPSTNAFDVAIHYRFLAGDEADYVGMARSYQQYLVDNGLLSDRLDGSADIGVRLEFLGAEKERILFWDRSIPVTTIAQMREILGQLDVKNPDVIYYGWQPRGAAAMYPGRVALDGTLGSGGQLREAAEEVAAANGRFSLYVDPQAAIEGASGYSTRNDISLAITNINLLGFNRGKLNYFLNMAALGERYRALSRAVNELGMGLAVDGLGSTLYSDFRGGRILTREQALQQYQALMEETGGEAAFYRPNAYMFPYMRAYYDMPLTDNGYLYTTQVVPFLQIALGGYVPMYGPPLNFSSNIQADLLRHADFGVYPSYFLTEAPTSAILNSSSDWIFSSSFAQWGDEVDTTYAWLNALLAPVKGQRIVSRETIGSGIVATTYENGQQIVVNYSTTPYTDGALFVEPQNAIIREVQP